jgi:hypothetical protein
MERSKRKARARIDRRREGSLLTPSRGRKGLKEGKPRETSIDSYLLFN